MSPLTSQPDHGTRNGLVMTVTLLILLIALALLLGGARPAHAQEVKPVPFAFADFTVRSRSPRLHDRRRCHRQPGRYLVLMPPINGATAASGTPSFSASPGDPYKAWDIHATSDFMPSQFVTFRAEFTHRAASVPYFAGAGGVTPPGGNTGPAGSIVPGWSPDLRKQENRVTLALLVKM